MHLPLNALRAFEAAARHLSFTRAADELSVSQAAVSQQVRNLEDRLGVLLFRRLPRGLALTAEGQALLPGIALAFDGLARELQRFQGGQHEEVLSVGVVGSYLVRCLLPALPAFREVHPWIDLRLFGHNNRVDLAGEGLDMAVRFGDGAWHGLEAREVLAAPLAPLASPARAELLKQPADLLAHPLLRSYRDDEWPRWFEQVGLDAPVLTGAVLDTTLALADAAAQGLGVALLPARLFSRELAQGTLVQPFRPTVLTGRYWLTRLKTRTETPAMEVFAEWLATLRPEADPRQTS